MGKCTAEDCSAHSFMVEAIRELKDMNKKIITTQDKLKETTIKIVASLESVNRIHIRLDKYEELQRMRDKEQDQKIDKVRIFMWKITGAISIAVPISFWLLKTYG